MRSIILASTVLGVFVFVIAAPAFAVPGEVANLQWCPGPKNCLQWDPVPTATQYRVYRGERTSFACLLNPSVESCDDGTFATTTTSGTITDIPPVGSLYWFLVTGTNGTGEGTAGAATTGARLQNVSGTCTLSCGVAAALCSVDADCCSAACIAGTCQSACCQPTTGFCTTHSDCCSGSCSANQCQPSCSDASQCPGVDSDCETRTCAAGTCGLSYAQAGTPTNTQVAGDCRASQCDGLGNIVSVVDDSDLPNDGNQCTDDLCVSGTPSIQARPVNSPCSQNGGSYCDGSGSCVQCNSATQCPGSDTECQQRTCSNFVCGVFFIPSGTPTSSQVPGDCHINRCDGAGGIASFINLADVPVDGNQCTNDICAAGVPENPPSSVGTACNQNGGTVCDGAGACVVAPQVVGTAPPNGASVAAGPNIAVVFSQAMNPSTLTGQTSAGACSGSIQVSLDDFASCIRFSTAAAAMSGGNTIGTFVPQPGLLVNRTYKIRVTTAAQNASGIAVASTFTLATGFTTNSANLCDGSLVISQIYGAGGITGSTYRNDFVELHNRGTSTISLFNVSIQYASAAGTTWGNATNLSGSIPPGGYYLIQEFSGGANGINIPSPDASGIIDMSSTNGKLALVAIQSPLSGACPLGGPMIDFVGYGATATCNEGGTNAPSPSTTTTISRVQNGCADVNVNGSDFASGAPNPRNSASPPSICACLVLNESNSAAEADACTISFPASLTVPTGTSSGLMFGRIFETGVTPTAGASPLVRAQLGYGPLTVNPEYQPGFTWINTTFNVQVGNDDEYQGSFTAPAVGSYGYLFRFSQDQGMSWTYGDRDGAGSNAGLTFDFANEGALTVTP